MKLHYFNQPVADGDDLELKMGIQQGYVPATCLLGGKLVMSEVRQGRNPCWGCAGPRHLCNGAAEVTREERERQKVQRAAAGRNGMAPAAPVAPVASGGYAQAASGLWLPTNCFYFLGVDPAPSRTEKADDGALAILRVRPRPGLSQPTASVGDWLCEYVWAYRLRGATARQWSGFIHLKHRQFGFAGICMDAQGGGVWVNDELILEKQLIEGVETRVVPIASLEDMERVGPNVQFLLTMYRRRDPGIKQMWPHLAGDDSLVEAMHMRFQEATMQAGVTWPQPFNERPREETEGWPDEKQWALKTLDAMREQLMNIQVEMREDGSYALSGNGAKRFSAAGKKDLAYAGIYAYVRFLVWLTMGGWEEDLGGAETEGTYVMSAA